jgi:YHS domain-containing protein
MTLRLVNVTIASLFIISLTACGGSNNKPAAKTAAAAKKTVKKVETKAGEAKTAMAPAKKCGCGKSVGGCTKVAFAFAAAPAVGTQATCPVSGDVFPVQANSTRSEHKGLHYAFCCKGCKAKFDAAPLKFITARSTCAGKAAAAPAAPAAADGVSTFFDAPPAVGSQARCPVGKKVFTVTANSARATHNGKHVAFCCPGCKGKFDAKPQAFAN